MKIKIGKKSLMKFGMWSAAVLAVAAVSFFLINYVIPVLAAPGDTAGPKYSSNVTYVQNITFYTLSNSTPYYKSSIFNFTAVWVNESVSDGGVVNDRAVDISNVTFNLGRPDGKYYNFSKANTSSYDVFNNNTAGRWWINLTVAQLGIGGPYSTIFGKYNYTWCANETSTANGVNCTQVIPFYVEADATAPILQNITPASSGYIYGKTNELFELNVSDYNLNTTNANTTLYYKLSTTSDWTSTTMDCYSSPSDPNYYCRKNVDLSGLFMEADVLQYFFNVSDIASNVGSNGTTTSPNTVTVDRTAPRWSSLGTNDTDNTIGQPDSINLTAYWTDNYALSRAILETNVTGAFLNISTGPRDGTVAWNISLSGTGMWSNFTWENKSLSLIRKTIAFRIYVNDSAGNGNVTNYFNFTVDETKPQWSGNVTNIPTTYNSGLSIFNVTWTDNVGMASIANNASIIEINFSGSMQNFTMISFNSTTYTYNNTLGAGFYIYRFYGNDTSGNMNVSDFIYNFTIGPDTPVVYLWLNGTAGSRNYNVGELMNITANITNSTGSVINVQLNITTNITGWGTISDITTMTPPVYNGTTLSMTANRYNITAYHNGSRNYSAASATYYATAYGWVNTTTVLNTTWIGGANTAIGRVLNITCNVTNSNTSATLEGYTVYIINQSTLQVLGTGQTIGNGYYYMTFTPLAEGQQTIRCGVLDDMTHYYNVSKNGTTTFTSDFTAPVLNITTPNNNSYVQGTATELFQINVTETNLNTTTNVTLYYRRQGITAWSNATLNCWNSAPGYTCNKTIVLNSYGDGNIIQYFFNASDNATNVGYNGTEAAFNNVTIDRTAPRWYYLGINDTDNITSKYDGINLTAYWNDSFGLSKAILETNETGEWQNKTGSTAAYGSPMTLSSTAMWSNFSWSNSTRTPSTVAFRIYVNDSSFGNWNVTDIYNFTMDNVPPRWNETTNQTTPANATGYVQGATYRFNISVADVVGVHTVLLEWYNGTAGANYTAARYNGSVTEGYWSYAFTDLLANSTGYTYRWYFNDTSGNWNTTINQLVYSIMNASTNMTLWMNGTSITGVNFRIPGTTSNTVVNRSAVVNLTAQLNVSGKIVSIFRNYSSLTGSSGNTPFTFNMSTSDLVAGDYRIEANWTGDANYSSASQVWNLTVIDTVPRYNETTNQTTPADGTGYVQGATYRFNISVADNLAIDTVLLEFQNDVSITNYTAARYNGSVTEGYWSKSFTDLAANATGYRYRWYFNDTSGNWNGTEANNFYVIVNASTNMTLWMNGTAVATGLTYKIPGTTANTNVNRSFVVNLTAQLNVSGKIVSIFRNYSSLTGGSGNTPFTFNMSTIDLAKADYRIEANWTGDANYSSASQVWNLTVTDSIKPTIANETVTPTLLHKYENITVNATLSDNDEISQAILQMGFPNGTYSNFTAGNYSMSNYTFRNYTFLLNISNTTTGIHNITVFANDTSGNWNLSTSPINFTVWGWSNLSLITSPATANKSTATPIVCKVKDSNSSGYLNNYLVSFYENETLRLNNVTNVTGDAVYHYSQASVGTYTIKCNITDNSTLYYNDSEYNSISVSITVNETSVAAPQVTGWSLTSYTSGVVNTSSPTLWVYTDLTGSCKYTTNPSNLTFAAMTEMSGIQNNHTLALSSLLDKSYTYYVKCNSTTVGTVMTTELTVRFDVDTRSSYNLTRPSTWSSIGDYFTVNAWNNFLLTTKVLQNTTIASPYPVATVLNSIASKYTIVNYNPGDTASTWLSFTPGVGGDLVNTNDTTGYRPYYVYVNTSNTRLQIN